MTNLFLIIFDQLNYDYLWQLENTYKSKFGFSLTSGNHQFGIFLPSQATSMGAKKNLNPSQKFLMVYLDSMIPIKSNYVIIHLFPLMIKPLSPFSTSGKSKFLAISAPSGYINGDKKNPHPSLKFLLVALDSMMPIKLNYVIVCLFPLMKSQLLS